MTRKYFVTLKIDCPVPIAKHRNSRLPVMISAKTPPIDKKQAASTKPQTPVIR